MPAGLTTGFPYHFQRFRRVRACCPARTTWPSPLVSCEQVENNGEEVRPALTRQVESKEQGVVRTISPPRTGVHLQRIRLSI